MRTFSADSWASCYRLITSTEEVMFYRACVFLYVCLQLHVKITDEIFMKILPEACLWTKEELTKFWKSSAFRSGSGSRNLLKDSSTLQDRTFSTLWLIYIWKLIRCSWKLYRRCTFRQGSPVKFWKSSGSRSWLRITGLWIWDSSSAGWSNSIAGWKAVCVSACLCVNQGGTIYNRCTYRLVILQCRPTDELWSQTNN